MSTLYWALFAVAILGMTALPLLLWASFRKRNMRSYYKPVYYDPPPNKGQRNV